MKMWRKCSETYRKTRKLNEKTRKSEENERNTFPKRHPKKFPKLKKKNKQIVTLGRCRASALMTKHVQSARSLQTEHVYPFFGKETVRWQKLAEHEADIEERSTARTTCAAASKQQILTLADLCRLKQRQMDHAFLFISRPIRNMGHSR